MRLKSVLIFFLLCLPCILYAQKQGQLRIDSLLKELPLQKEDTGKVKVLYTISKE